MQFDWIKDDTSIIKVIGVGGGGSSTTSTVVSDGLRAGWPTILTLLTRDQYGRLVHVPNLKVSY